MTTTPTAVEHGITITEVITPAGTPRRADCFCGWQSKLLPSNPQALAAGEAHIAASAEPVSPMGDSSLRRAASTRYGHIVDDIERIRQAAYDDGFEDGIASATETVVRTCPQWCANPDCDGSDHSGEMLMVPATASRTARYLRMITTRATRYSGAEPSVCLHIGGGGENDEVDEEAFLRVAEVQQLIEHLQVAVGHHTAEAGR